MNRVVVITGASSGIGLAAAVGFARAGDSVVATLRDPSRQGPLRAAAESAGVEMDVEQLDVTDDASADTLLATVLARHGRIDVLVNNAGLGFIGTLEELSLEDLRRSMEVNFFGVARLTKAVLPIMRSAGGGHVIAVTSLGGVLGQPFNDAYCAAKFAVEGLYESLHPVAARFGVHVSIVEPGPVDTEFRSRSVVAGHGDDPELDSLRERYLEVTGPGSTRSQSAEDAASVIVAATADTPPVLRYQTSNLTRRLAGRKLADVTGEQVVAFTSTWLDDEPPA